MLGRMRFCKIPFKYFDTALASGTSPEQAMAEAAEASGLEGPGQANPIESNPSNPNSLSNPITSPINAIITSGPIGSYAGMMSASMGSADIMTGPSGPGGIVGTPIGLGAIDLLSGPIGPAFGDIYSQTEVEVFQESFFFDDPSLYNVKMEQEPEPESTETESSSIYINGVSDFGRTISDFSLSKSITINYTFDQPSATYSVTRSSFYEYTSTAATTSLSWDSRPSTTSQTVNETESNGSFGSAQVIARSRFKIATNSDVGDDSIPWVKIQNGYINNGIDMFNIILILHSRQF